MQNTEKKTSFVCINKKKNHKARYIFALRALTGSHSLFLLKTFFFTHCGVCVLLWNRSPLKHCPTTHVPDVVWAVHWYMKNEYEINENKRRLSVRRSVPVYRTGQGCRLSFQICNTDKKTQMLGKFKIQLILFRIN